jgi:acetyl-CoA C-acetyltransferase
MERADLSRSPAAVLAARHAIEMAGVKASDLATIDLYSCFPAPVFNICEGLRILPDDPRGLTLTGGLPFFGGAGNNYSMHAIAETVQRARSRPGSFGFVGANGGIMSKYSAGVYSTAPVPWKPDNPRRETHGHRHRPARLRRKALRRQRRRRGTARPALLRRVDWRPHIRAVVRNRK